MGAFDFNTDVQVLLICAGALTVLVFGTHAITKRIRREHPEQEPAPAPELRRTNPECSLRCHYIRLVADEHGVMRWTCLRDGCDETWPDWPFAGQDEPFDQERAS